MQDFEKLGQFFLGRELDLASGDVSPNPLLYDSRDLTTHAVVVGMTGSGKTGLCINLLEEAGLDRIPAIVIDPKGDISNLLLTFPGLSPAEFRPWIDESQASREGLSADDFAAQEAEKWRDGLARWGQDGARIATFLETVDLQLYTPGSSGGRPITVLKSFTAPDEAFRKDLDAMRERVTSAVSGLLALLGVDADPIRSREHILLSNILNGAWSAGRDMNLGQVIAEIQNPPFTQVGIMDLDSFFPAKERTELAMTMNNLLASPSFAAWMSGEPLDIKRLLHTRDGKPRISIMSIAHLSDAERMFFVTILLNEVLAWMRNQDGTSSLRALLYMDEVFGYFPPTANPPSKLPMLTLLKQARAYGLGVVLATQNPVDLDYKGLSNTGTWFLGRLQTERDKARVIEGLEGAAANTGASFNRGEIEQILSGLGSRRFLMNNVHDDHPVVFETRWAMSYLRGPLTRNQLQQLAGSASATEKESPPAAAAMSGGNATPVATPAITEAVEVDPRQLIPADVEQHFAELDRRPASGERIVYRPAVLGSGRVHYVRATYKVDVWSERTFLKLLQGDDLPDEIWDHSEPVPGTLNLDDAPYQPCSFSALPAPMTLAKQYKTWEKELIDYLYRCNDLTLFRCNELKTVSEPFESRGDFLVRLEQLASERRDLEVEQLRRKYAEKFASLRERIRKAEVRVEKERDQYKQKRLDSVLSMGGSIMGALLGRKSLSVTNARRASSSMRSLGRAVSERSDIGRAEENVADLQAESKALEEKFNQDVEATRDKLRVDKLELESLSVPPRKSEIAINGLKVIWLPFRVDARGIVEPAWQACRVSVESSFVGSIRNHVPIRQERLV